MIDDLPGRRGIALSIVLSGSLIKDPDARKEFLKLPKSIRRMTAIRIMFEKVTEPADEQEREPEPA